MQAFHCVARLFGTVSKKDAASFAHVDNYVSEKGPILPLVVVRLLNRIAGSLLTGFAEQNQNNGLETGYPFGTRTTGSILDAKLHKASKCLYGFTSFSAGTRG